MNALKWKNLPIPEGHVLPLCVGLALQVFFPRPLFKSSRLKSIFGWPFLLLGALLVAWAVGAVRDVDIERPNRVIDSGPYRFSRNPMYVGWTLIYAGLVVLVNTCWLLIFLPGVLVFTHFFAIRQEEQRLAREFDESYRRYSASVRRYL